MARWDDGTMAGWQDGGLWGRVGGWYVNLVYCGGGYFMRILIACERSGGIRRAFRARGHEAYSCDIEASRDLTPYHIKRDALSVLGDGWDMMIAHPPCTWLTRANPRRDSNPQAVEAGKTFVRALWDAPIPMVCIENPEGYARLAIGAPSQIVQPFQFGHPFTKRTLLWYRGLPPLFSTAVVLPQASWTDRQRPGPYRQEMRSRTFEGLALAMAEQWG